MSVYVYIHFGLVRRTEGGGRSGVIVLIDGGKDVEDRLGCYFLLFRKEVIKPTLGLSPLDRYNIESPTHHI
jgi:hypothetical protein